MKDSLYVRFNDGRVVELAIYEKTDGFPHPTRYASVVTAAGRHGYHPLDELGGEYDSGVRFTESTTGDVYQVCARAATNVVNTYLHANNYFGPLTATTAYNSLRAVFEDRVSVRW